MTHDGSTYQVTIAKYGTRVGRRAEVYLNYPLYGEPDDDIGMDYFFWVVASPDRTVVVDTGFSPAGGARRSRTTLLEPAQLLERLGVDREAVETVVITHAHYDHIGNLDLFPAAEFVIAERELAFWSGVHAGRRQFHHSVEDEELARLRELDRAGRVRTYRDRLSLAPGVEVLELGGHTPGQSAVLVQTAEGPALLASDAIHYYEEYERDMPFMSVAELVRMYEGFDAVRAMVADGTVRHLVSGHDPDTLARFRPHDDPGLRHLVATIG